MSFQIVTDLRCNKCGGIYPSSYQRQTLTIIVNNVFLSICPNCTEEVTNAIGYTVENITKELAHIKEAETENNRKRAIQEGEVCSECEQKFASGEPRVRTDNASNVPAWHSRCYTEDKE